MSIFLLMVVSWLHYGTIFYTFTILFLPKKIRQSGVSYSISDHLGREDLSKFLFNSFFYYR